MRTKRMLKRAKATDAGSVVKHALDMGWTPTLIHKHGNAAVRAALRTGVAQPVVAYTPSGKAGEQDRFFRAQAAKTERPTPTRKPAKRKPAKRTTPRVRAARKVEEPITKGADFTNAEQHQIRALRNGEYSFGNLYILPARAKASGKGLTHDVQYHMFFGETVHVEQKTLSAQALVRFLGGERTEQWLDGHGYVVTRVMPDEIE
jgi:hypothetical protein